MKDIPQYLKQYIVEQNYSQYSPIDHACWRFIMRLNKAYFSNHAHSKYLEGLDKTGITIEEIPKIDNINKKLQKFGWSAVGVKGFLPPLIFMDFQSRGILPIACDMRSIEHLTYTPAPDIVHEAAGHSPMIADHDYAEYLKYYGQIAHKAISSSEDYDLYIAIRELSDIKEDPSSTELEIEQSEEKLKKASEAISYISEAAYLARINWWTVEYGLIGNISNPKIYGAGLLSSIGESENCLKDSIKKIPLSINCIDYNYDITEQQPQLFISKDFKSLNLILDQFSSKMAYKVGGLEGLKKAVQSKTICTALLNSGVQVSGQFQSIMDDKLSYIQLSGPTQICYKNQQIDGHGVDRHPEGFGFPIGALSNKLCINQLSQKKFSELGYKINKKIELEFESKVIIEGKIKNILEKDSKIKIITFSDCTVSHNGTVLFNPEWGEYDLVCSESIESVFGGAADMDSYYHPQTEYSQIQKLNKRISQSNIDQELNKIYSDIRSIRNNGVNMDELKKLFDSLSKNYPDDWLAKLEIYEIVYDTEFAGWAAEIKESIQLKAIEESDLSKAIKNSLQLIEK